MILTSVDDIKNSSTKFLISLADIYEYNDTKIPITPNYNGNDAKFLIRLEHNYKQKYTEILIPDDIPKGKYAKILISLADIYKYNDTKILIRPATNKYSDTKTIENPADIHSDSDTKIPISPSENTDVGTTRRVLDACDMFITIVGIVIIIFAVFVMLFLYLRGNQWI